MTIRYADFCSLTTQVYTDVVQKPLDAVTSGVKGLGGLISNPLIWLVGGVAAIAILPPLLGAARGK